jgi:hypothetical protein
MSSTNQKEGILWEISRLLFEHLLTGNDNRRYRQRLIFRQSNVVSEATKRSSEAKASVLNVIKSTQRTTKLSTTLRLGLRMTRPQNLRFIMAVDFMRLEYL